MQQLRKNGDHIPPGHAPNSYIPDLCRLPVVLSVLLLTQLLVVIYVLSLHSITQFDWQQLALMSLYSQWVSLLSLAGLCSLRRYVNRWSVAMASLSCLAWVGVAVCVVNTGAQWVQSGRELQNWSVWWSSGWLLRDEIIYQVLAAIALRYLYIIHLWRRQQVATHSAQLDALNARIRPHFLFNTMNTIAGLISYAPDQAEEAVEDLSTLMRSSLSARQPMSNWQQELELSLAYCRIEQQRLGERLQFNWMLNELSGDEPIPPLVLQPLLENAIYHGVERCPEGGVVNVRAEIVESDRGRNMSLIIDNPYMYAHTNTDHEHNGIALENIRARLASLYFDPNTIEPRAYLHTEERDGRYIASLFIPLDFDLNEVAGA